MVRRHTANSSKKASGWMTCSTERMLPDLVKETTVTPTPQSTSMRHYHIRRLNATVLNASVYTDLLAHVELQLLPAGLP
jgi:hypothetical protein